MTEFKTAWFVHEIFDMLFNVLFKLSPLPQMAVLRFEHLSEDVCLLSSTFQVLFHQVPCQHWYF